MPDDSSMLGAAKLITNVGHTAAAAALYRFIGEIYFNYCCAAIQQRVCIIDEIRDDGNQIDGGKCIQGCSKQKKRCARQVLNYISRLQIGKLLYRFFLCQLTNDVCVYIIMYRLDLP